MNKPKKLNNNDNICGKCDICGNKAALNRKYYYYGIKCKCHSPEHFELVCYCNDCKDKVKPPKRTVIEIEPTKEW